MRLIRMTILAGILMIQQPALAASNDYEIDLRELRRITPARPAKAEPRKQRHIPAEPAGKTAESGHESIYVVRPGDHLFQILMKTYGLSDPEAERLIPDIMHLNGISSPKGLRVGQRLRIPLPAGVKSGSTAPRTAAPQPPQQHTTPPAAATEKPATPEQSSIAAVTPHEAEIVSLIYESPCKLVQSLVKKLGVPATAAAGITGVETAAASHAGHDLIVICGVPEAEQYTYERLLASSNKLLLFFAGDESADDVVTEFADSLELKIRKRDADAASALPPSYVFPPFGTRVQELQLIIFPSAQ